MSNIVATVMVILAVYCIYIILHKGQSPDYERTKLQTQYHNIEWIDNVMWQWWYKPPTSYLIAIVQCPLLLQYTYYIMLNVVISGIAVIIRLIDITMRVGMTVNCVRAGFTIIV